MSPTRTMDGNDLRAVSVLIVEDEYIIAEYARDVLAACAARVAVAADEAAARVLIDAHAGSAEGARFDAAVLNVKLAGRVSYPLAERLAEARIPFAFASGFDHLKLRADGFGSVAWLPKPYTPIKLLTMVNGLISERFGQRHPAAQPA